MSADARHHFAQWRERARALLVAGVPPDQVHWDDGHASLFTTPALDSAAGATEVRIPARILPLLEDVHCHRSPWRLGIMYRALWRIAHGERELLDDPVDEDAAALRRMRQDVKRDTHKMTAFVRFRELRDEEGAVRWIAWYEPQHRVLQRTAPFFVSRFASMVWTIATPDGIAAWDRETLRFLAPDPDLAPPPEDAGEALWLAYYRAIFNPARLNVRAMQREMPQAFWRNLPEAKVIPKLVAEASERAGGMVQRAPRENTRFDKARALRPSTTEAPLPEAIDPSSCRRCELWERATQAVRGEGAAHAAIMLVGEQPGDEEDLKGRPFVGPAGKLLRRALDEAGLDATTVFITNAVKHFSWEPRGKRRIHKTPAQRHVDACRVWLHEEVATHRPRVIVALGGTALQSVLQTKMSVTAGRAARELRHASGADVVATFHPSAALRAQDDDALAIYRALVADLQRARSIAEAAAPEVSPAAGPDA